MQVCLAAPAPAGVKALSTTTYTTRTRHEAQGARHEPSPKYRRQFVLAQLQALEPLSLSLSFCLPAEKQPRAERGTSCWRQSPSPHPSPDLTTCYPGSRTGAPPGLPIPPPNNCHPTHTQSSYAIIRTGAIQVIDTPPPLRSTLEAYLVVF